MQRWNYNATIKDGIQPMTKKFIENQNYFTYIQMSWKIMFPMQTLAFMYMISEWKLLSLQNHVKMSTTYNPTHTLIVTTLALGSRPKQGLARVRAKSEARESHFMFLGGWDYRRVWENEHSHSQVRSHFGSWSLGEVLNF
jgi:hypothetical protein